MKTVPLRRLIQSVENGVWGGEPGTDEVDVACVRAADFDFSSMRVSLSRAPIRSVPTRSFDRLRLRSGDIVLEKSGGGEAAPVGRSVIFDLNEPAVTSNFAARVRPTSDVDPRYLNFVLRSHYDAGATLRCIKQTTGIQNLDTEEWLATPTIQHSFSTQRQIADFLDDHVSRIDRVIAVRQAQLRAVGESHDAQWDEWTRHIGGQRELVPLRRFITSIVDGPFGSSLASSHYSDEGIRVIRLGNIGTGYFKDWDKAFISEEHAKQLRSHAAVAGDLIMAGLGDERWPLGRCAVVPAGVTPAIVKADCYRIRLDERIDHDFAAAFLSSPSARSRARLLSRGSTRARMNTDIARAVCVAPIDLTRQHEYVRDVTKSRVDLDGAASALARTIDVLAELKTSVTTAAVTGELDVTTAGSGIPA